MTFDLEFEKLLIMLKGQYHSLFDKRKLKIESQSNQDGNQYFDQDSESDSDYEDQEPSSKFIIQPSNPRLNNQLSNPRANNQAQNTKFGYIANRSPYKKKEEPIMEVRGK